MGAIFDIIWLFVDDFLFGVIQSEQSSPPAKILAFTLLTALFLASVWFLIEVVLFLNELSQVLG